MKAATMYLHTHMHKCTHTSNYTYIPTHLTRRVIPINENTIITAIINSHRFVDVAV